jgi:hypothetical protein
MSFCKAQKATTISFDKVDSFLFSFKLLNCTEFWTFGFGFEAVEIDRIVGETGEFNLM